MPGWHQAAAWGRSGSARRPGPCTAGTAPAGPARSRLRRGVVLGLQDLLLSLVIGIRVVRAAQVMINAGAAARAEVVVGLIVRPVPAVAVVVRVAAHGRHSRRRSRSRAAMISPCSHASAGRPLTADTSAGAGPGTTRVRAGSCMHSAEPANGDGAGPAH